MAKNDKRKFELNKGSEHDFDISKGSKRKFDLTKEDNEVVSSATSSYKVEEQIKPASTQPSQQATKEANNSKKWIILAVVIVILALLAWWIFAGNNNPADEQTPLETTEVPQETSTDSITTADENVDDATEEIDAVPSEDEHSTASQSAEPINNSNQETASATVADTPSKAQPNSSAKVSDDIEVEAMKVIRGEYGNNPERKNALGVHYHDIQARVNQLMSK